MKSSAHYWVPLCLWICYPRATRAASSTEDRENLMASQRKDYQNEWVVRIEGGPEVASLLALQSGYEHLGPVLGFEDTYLWRANDHHRQEKRGHFRLGKNLNSHAKVIWAERQKIIHRHKRDYVPSMDVSAEKPLIREKRVEPTFNDSDSVMPTEISKMGRKRGKKIKDHGSERGRTNIDRRQRRWTNEADDSKMFNDELWDQEWYLQDTRSSNDLPKLDLNVVPLYRLGITGRNIRVAVLDDGLEYTHDDLSANYDAEISYDVNEGDHDPIPRYESTGINGHGTRCAGEIAMRANNGKCGVGIAFDASIGGIKLLDGVVNDRVEGEALGYRPDLVDVYTASWGPADDGKSLEAPGRLAREALLKGITQGRNGKGSVYVWASGNGGSKSDDCGCDGYVGSIYTIAVGSASQTGRFPWYGERCPATMATTYSSGAYHDQMIATTDLKNTCTTKHTGTSASAPLAAGILALALQVNNELTWRDVQHLIVWTSEYNPLSENPGWFKNAAGFWFNPRFGFGLMNAFTLVTTGRNWTTVPEKRECRVDVAHVSSETLRYDETTRVIFVTDGCFRTENHIRYLEHVQIEFNIHYTVRGALDVHLTTPSGTTVTILTPRELDDSNEGFTDWKFMSVASWGEDPRGIWLLRISDTVGPADNNGTLGKFALILHGTETEPSHARYGPRTYDVEYNRIRKMDHAAGTFLSQDPSNLLDLDDFEDNFTESERNKRIDTRRRKNWPNYPEIL